MLAALSSLAQPAAAQSGASIHLDISAGSFAGAYDVESRMACVVDETGAWSVSFSDVAQAPSGIELSVGGDLDNLIVEFGSGEGYISTALTHNVKQHDGSVSLTVAAADASDLATGGLGGTIASIKMSVECHEIQGAGVPEPTPAPLPTPQVQGPPAAGSSVFHIYLDFGPRAGTYDAWTMDDACFESAQGFWSARFDDPAALPSTISLIAARGGASDGTVGSLSILFGSLPEVTRYRSTPAASITIDDAGNVQLFDTAARARLPDLTEVDGTLQLSITCAAVVR